MFKNGFFLMKMPNDEGPVGRSRRFGDSRFTNPNFQDATDRELEKTVMHMKGWEAEEHMLGDGFTLESAWNQAGKKLTAYVKNGKRVTLQFDSVRPSAEVEEVRVIHF